MWGRTSEALKGAEATEGARCWATTHHDHRTTASLQDYAFARWRVRTLNRFGSERPNTPAFVVIRRGVLDTPRDWELTQYPIVWYYASTVAAHITQPSCAKA
jgi:hypothetical protein